MKHEPRHIDASKVALPEELRRLVDLLMENRRELWAQQPGDDGSESSALSPDRASRPSGFDPEKAHDRNVIVGALKAMLSLGYRMEKPTIDALSGSALPDNALSDVLEQLKGAEKLRLPALLSIWRRATLSEAAGPPEIYELLGDRILSVGCPLLAHNIVSRGLDNWPANVRLRQLCALALARSGATEKANSMLRQLREEGHADSETLGLLARTHKDLWEQAAKPEQRREHLRRAHELYREAYTSRERRKVDDMIYTGINAASTAVLLDNGANAAEIADEVRLLCREKLKSSDDYWARATLGEAAVILRRWEEAEEQYTLAGELGRGNYGDLCSARRNAQLLLEHIGEDRRRFDECFRIPKVLVFSGHMVDRPGRPKPRFPRRLEDRVRAELAGRLKKYKNKIGYSSAACGGDILFLEEMLRQDSEINIVLPFPREEFEKISVDIVPGTDWKERFRRVITRSARLIVASEHWVGGSPVAYEYSNLMQDGLARLRAQMLGTEVIPVVVWDGAPGDGPSGTASLVERWQSDGLRPEIVNMRQLLAQSAADPAAAERITVATKGQDGMKRAAELPQQIRAILVADVIKYGSLNDCQIPLFEQHFVTAVADLTSECAYPPAAKNRWGDAFYFVFERVEDAGRFALDLRDLLWRTNWVEKELPENLSLRIALHAGPVFSAVDPITGLRNFVGSHVVHAARIEPITPASQVYASQAFASLAATARVKDFRCDYVGDIPLAKGFGSSPTYHVRHCHAEQES